MYLFVHKDLHKGGGGGFSLVCEALLGVSSCTIQYECLGLLHSTTWRVLTIYAPVIYTRPCIMFWRRGYTLRGEVGGGWALEFPSFLGPVKWHRADRRVPFASSCLS
jgi:hypothetical protein